MIQNISPPCIDCHGTGDIDQPYINAITNLVFSLIQISLTHNSSLKLNTPTSLHTTLSNTLIMGCSSSKPVDNSGKQRNDEIENQLKKDRALMRNEIKMLLLGILYIHNADNRCR